MSTENQRELILTEEFNKLRYDVESKLLISKENNSAMYENWTKKIVDYHNEITTVQSDIDLLELEVEKLNKKIDTCKIFIGLLIIVNLAIIINM